MSTKILVGEQLEGQILYERQKQLRASQNFLPGPIIVSIRMQTPENIGSVLRLADAAGSPRVIFVNDDMLSPHPKTTMKLDQGARKPSFGMRRQQRNRTRSERTARNSDALVEWAFWTPAQFLKQNNELPNLIALELTTSSTSIFETELPNPCALIVGSEQHGIPAPMLARCQRAVHIPMYGVNGSMNVTHALAVALFEWRRQHYHAA